MVCVSQSGTKQGIKARDKFQQHKHQSICHTLTNPSIPIYIQGKHIIIQMKNQQTIPQET